MSSLGTDLLTLTAGDTSHWIDKKFLFGVNGFRVVAPDTPEAAPFEEDRGTNPRAVMNREPFDVEDPALRSAGSSTDRGLGVRFMIWFKVHG